MGTGYTRADTANNIADGNIINASDLDSEYDAIQSAFDASTGHTHDGTAGEGAPIETIGPSQDVVATASVLRPKTDNTVDLGTTSLEYKDLFLDGTAHIDTLDVDENASITGTLGVTGTTTLGTANITTGTITTADINGGNIDGTIIGASSAAAITGTTITGTSFVTSGNMTFGDNDKAVFGAGSDLQIYHNGSNSYISEGGTGNLYIEADNQLILRSASGELYGKFERDSAVTLYYDNAAKLATTSTGIDVTGTVTADGLTVDGTGINALNVDYAVGTSYSASNASNSATARIQNSNGTTGTYAALGFRVGSSDSSIGFTATGTNAGDFFVNTDGGSNGIERLRIANNGDISFYEDTGTTAKFFWDASAETLDIGSYVGSSVNAPLNLKSDANHHGLSIEENSGTETWQLGVDVDGDLNFHNSGNATPSVTFSDSGSVGIGTSSPAEELDISADAPSMQLSSTNASGRNYGLQSTNNGKFAFYDGTAGVNRMVISSSGSVGIGASSPENSLHVSSSTATSQILVQGDSNDASIKLNKSGQTFVIGIDATDDSFRIADNPTLGTNDRLVIDASGNVGIGTSSPNSKLTLSTGDKIFVPTGEALNFGHTTGSANTERMRIDSSGNVGIGTSSPSDKLHVDGSSSTDGILIKNPLSGSFYNAKLEFTRDSTLGGAKIQTERNAAGGVGLSFNYTSSNANEVSGTYSEAMRLDASGNLLVGGTDTFPHDNAATSGTAIGASGYLSIARSGGVSGYFNRMTSDGDIMQFRKDGSTVGSIGTYAGDLTIGDDDIGIRFDTGSGLVPWDLGATTTGGSARDAAIDIGVASARFKDLYLSSSIKITGSGDKSISLTSGTGSTSVINMGDGDDIDAGQIVYDNANNSMQVKTNGTERMRIDSSGNLLVGTTSVFSGSGIVPLVTITGATGGIGVNSIGSAEVGLATRPSASHNYYAGFFLNNSGSGVGNITVTGSSTAYNTSSDHRLKENVVDLTGATARLNQLAPKRFNFIADADTTVDGFIAHEVQAVVPEAITGTHNEVDADGNPVYQGIDQSKLVPLLVATIKELEARITALENA